MHAILSVPEKTYGPVFDHLYRSACAQQLMRAERLRAMSINHQINDQASIGTTRSGKYVEFPRNRAS